ncbi:hypothetical protein K2P97_05800 [bacterium]|nr:hypothetical protein [bacterium]
MKLNLWITLPLSMICVLANAQGTASTTTTTATTATTTAAAPAATSTAAPTKEEAPKVKLGLSYDAKYSLQAETQTDEKTGVKTRSQGLSHTFTGTMGYGDYNSFATMTYEQDLLDSNASAWSDASLGASKKAWKLGEYFKLGPSMSLGLPLKDSTRNATGLQYSIGGGLKLTLNTKAFAMDSLSVSHAVSATKFFTNYDTTSSGSPSRSHRIRNQTVIGYNITDSLSVEGLGRLDSNYSVNGVVTNFFILSESLSYSLNDNVSVGISHSNAANYLNSQKDYQNNFKLYDSESSSYAVSLSVSL